MSKSKTKPVNGMSQLTDSLTKLFTPDAEDKAKAAALKKAANEAERAKRFPVATAQEAAKKAGLPKPKATRAATPKVEKVEKAKSPAVAFVQRTIKAGQPLFAIAEAARPVAGTRLFAHTHAALSIMGMLDAKHPAVPKSVVTTVMGQRAVVYHVKQGNFEDAPNHGLRLTTSGRNKFVNRYNEGFIDGKLANAFASLFLEGKIADTAVAKGQVFQVGV